MPYLDQPGASMASSRPFDLRDRGLLLADGVFDTAMIVDGRMCFREAHLARLLGDARALGIEVEPPRLEAAVDGALAEAGELERGALRVTVTRGPGARGLAPVGTGEPTVLASCAPVDPARAFAPVRVVLSRIRRNETSPTARHKTLAYLDSVLAAREAAEAGADEALLLNTQGRLACCAAANIFILEGDILRTPAAEEGALPGVIRGWVLAHARRVGLRAEEGRIRPEEAERADSAFVTGSLRLIAPASGVTRGAGEAPPAVARLMDLLREALGA